MSLCVTPGPRSTEQSDQGPPSPERFAVVYRSQHIRCKPSLLSYAPLTRARRGWSTETVLGLWRAWGLGSRDLIPRLSRSDGRSGLPLRVQCRAAAICLWYTSLRGAPWVPMGAPQKLVYRKQIAAALHWLESFALGNHCGLSSKTFYLEDRFRDGVVLVCDASLWGGGAACWASASEYYNNVPPLAYLSVNWTSWHERLLNVMVGSPAQRGTFEAYTFLLAVTKWAIEITRGRVIVVGDALGGMHGVITLSAKSDTVNKIAMELALHLAPLVPKFGRHPDMG